MRLRFISIVIALIGIFILTPVLRAAPKDDDSARGTKPAAGGQLDATKGMTVLLVSKGNAFLEKIKSAMEFKKFDMVAPADYEKSKPTRYDVVVFDCYSPQFIPGSGGFIYFNCLPPDSKIKAVKEGDRAVLVEDNSLKDWKRDHAVFDQAQFKGIFVKTGMKVDVPADGVERLMEGSNGPLILLETGKQSKHLVVTFDIMNSDWPLKVSFPVFMYDSMVFLGKR